MTQDSNQMNGNCFSGYWVNNFWTIPTTLWTPDSCIKQVLEAPPGYPVCTENMPKPNAPFPLTEPTLSPQPFFQSGQNLGVILDTSFLYLTCHPLAKSVRSAVKICPEYDQLSASATSSRVQAGAHYPVYTVAAIPTVRIVKHVWIGCQRKLS